MRLSSSSTGVRYEPTQIHDATACSFVFVTRGVYALLQDVGQQAAHVLVMFTPAGSTGSRAIRDGPRRRGRPAAFVSIGRAVEM
jgi:hypothetical protein